VLALDHGRARTGVAVSDPTGVLVRPLPAIPRIDSAEGRRTLAEVVETERPERIVVGEPRHLSGARGAQAREAAAFAERLRSRFGLPVDLVDERLSTVEAGRRLRDASRRRGGADLDSAAACVLLDAYLAAPR